MSKEAMRLALEALTATMSTHGFQKHIDQSKDEAITALREALAEQPAQHEKDWGAVGEAHIAAIKKSSKAMVEDAVVRAAHKVMAEFEAKLDERLMEPPAQQEPVAWRNAALRVGEDLCSVGPFGYYDMTAEQWLDWALSVVTVYAPPRTQPPAQRKPLPYNKDDMEGLDINQRLGFKLGWKSAEEAHGIKENT